MASKKIFSKVLLYIFILIVLMFTLLPLAYTISASLKSNQEIMLGGSHLIPRELSLDNFSKAWSLGHFGRYTLNSIFVSFFSVIGVLINSTMAAYVFARSRFPGRKILLGLYLGTMFISAGAIILFPLVTVLAKLGLNNLGGVIINNIFGLNVVYLFLAMGYFRTINKEIDNAAEIDGCSFFRIYWNIIIPLAKPMLATIALVSFRQAWNDWLLPMVLTIGSSSRYTLSVGVVSLRNVGGEGASQWNLMMAGAVFSIIPIVIVYLFLNRYFISGLTSGSLKT